MTKEKAENVYNNSIGAAFRNQYEIVEVNAITSSQQEQQEAKSSFDWDMISRQNMQFYQDLQAYRESPNEQMSIVDHEICDIQHYMEFYTLDAAKGYKAYRMLKERLVRRRFIKDEIIRADCFLAGTAAAFAEGKVEKQLQGLNNRKYVPRVLNELFGLQATG